jgi:hypothetical protein
VHYTRTSCRTPLPTLLLVLGLLALVLLPRPGDAQESGLAIVAAGSTLVEGQHRVDAVIDYRLSRQALEALQNGVALTFEVVVVLSQVRRWWFDGEVVTRRQVSRLSYDPLAQTYVLRDTRSGEQRSFTTLYAALKALGRVEGLLLVEDSRLEAGVAYEAGIRAALDQERLPGPLRLLAFWEEGLNLESEWFRWTLVR